MLDRDRVRTFYTFMQERESIRLRRLAGLPREQWTQDPIFQQYSFTNVRREHDRTTRRFKEIYDRWYGSVDKASSNFEELDRRLLINCALYRYFGTVQSAEKIGWVAEWTPYERDRVMLLGDDGWLSFTAAYIVTSGGRSEPKHYVVADTIDELWVRAIEVISQSCWEDAIAVMCRCYGVGSFMAKEVYLDYLLATGYRPADWETWTPVGPGGRRGACRVKLGWADKIPEDDALEVIREVYAMRNELSGTSGVTLWPKSFYVSEEVAPSSYRVAEIPSVSLDLTDVQFQMCEFDKYSRVAEGRRPKRRFRPTVDEITRG